MTSTLFLLYSYSIERERENGTVNLLLYNVVFYLRRHRKNEDFFSKILFNNKDEAKKETSKHLDYGRMDDATSN